MFRPLLPRIYMIVEEINRRHLEEVRERFPNDDQMVRELSIIEDGQVHMARLAIVGSHSVNGVAAIHTEILKSDTLKFFNRYYPKKFNNKTNGITHRRWLISANPELTALIDETIGDAWQKAPDQLSRLNDHVTDKAFLAELSKIKRLRKVELSDYIHAHGGVLVDPDMIFDVQVKRIHSYKRQIMNILHIMYLYHELKTNKRFSIPPTARFFGGKAGGVERGGALGEFGLQAADFGLVLRRLFVVFVVLLFEAGEAGLLFARVLREVLLLLAALFEFAPQPGKAGGAL